MGEGLRVRSEEQTACSLGVSSKLVDRKIGAGADDHALVLEVVDTIVALMTKGGMQSFACLA